MQLEKLGYRYIKAENGKEAVEFMKTRFGKSQCESSSSSNAVDSQSLETKTDISLILMNCSMVRKIIIIDVEQLGSHLLVGISDFNVLTYWNNKDESVMRIIMNHCYLQLE